MASSEDDKEQISRATGTIDGQKLCGISFDPAQGMSTFEFDLGGRLETRPYGNDPSEEQWFIYGRDKVFTYRADGQYSLQDADTQPSDESWDTIT